MSIFADRHIGPDHDAEQKMLEVVGHPDLDSLIDATVPQGIRAARSLKLPAALSEQDALATLDGLAGRAAVLTAHCRDAASPRCSAREGRDHLTFQQVQRA